MDLNRRLHALRLLLVACSWFLVAAAPAAPADEGGRYAGAYAGDLVWAGTVTMTGDVLILAGGTLTIRPGTTVRVIAAEGTQIDPEYLSPQTELLVRGALDIQGTVDAPVRFVVVDRPGLEDYPWAGITLDRAGKSRVAHAEFLGADMAIRCVGSSPKIVGNRIADCRYGIVAQQQSHPEVVDNLLQGGEGGIFCWRGSNAVLSGNRIIGHDEEAVFVDADSRPKLGRNLIRDNAIGLALYPRDLAVDLSEVTGNGEDLRWLGRQGLPGGAP